MQRTKSSEPVSSGEMSILSTCYTRPGIVHVMNVHVSPEKNPVQVLHLMFTIKMNEALESMSLPAVYNIYTEMIHRTTVSQYRARYLEFTPPESR